jgi:hypothetical protein
LQPDNTNSTVSLERHHDVEDGMEFGDDLVFKAPTRFLVDVSLDDAPRLLWQTNECVCDRAETNPKTRIVFL